MTIKEALLQCLTEKALGLTKPEVEKILHDELEKPESEVDCDVIDMCIELLAEIDNVKLPEDTGIPPELKIIPPVRKKRHWKAVLLVAAIFVFTVSATLLVSAQVFHFDIVHYVVELFSDHVSVDYGGTKPTGRKLSAGRYGSEERSWRPAAFRLSFYRTSS